MWGQGHGDRLSLPLLGRPCGQPSPPHPWSLAGAPGAAPCLGILGLLVPGATQDRQLPGQNPAAPGVHLGMPGPGRASGGRRQRGDPTEPGKGPGAATQPGRAGLACGQGRGGAGVGPGSPRLPACPGPQPSRASPPPLGAGGHRASQAGEGLPGPPRQLPARPHRRPRWWPSADSTAGRPRSRLEPGQRPWASAQSGRAGGGLPGCPGLGGGGPWVALGSSG